jgi:ABC-type nitrate/sulfonate/bicarbonate transport system ATPase subunit
MKLQMRQQMRRSQEEIEANFNPINLNYIFQEDLLFQWIEERENLLLDGVQKCLMVVYSR